MENENPLIKSAYQFAQIRYGLLKYPNSSELYFHHALNVYFEVFSLTNDPDTRIAAMLHDLVRIKVIRPADISRHFGRDAAFLVESVTPDKRRMESMGEVLYHIMWINSMNSRARLIKICERMDEVKMLFKLKEKFLNENPDYQSEFCDRTLEIMEGLKRDRFDVKSRLAFEGLMREVEASYEKIEEAKEKEVDTDS